MRAGGRGGQNPGRVSKCSIRTQLEEASAVQGDMTAEMAREQARAVDAVRRAVACIDRAEFAAYGGGWPQEIGTALVDAAFSMQVRYHSKNPGAGVFHRVQKIQSAFPRATDDLEALAAAENLPRVGAKDARELVVQSHGQDDHGVGLIAYEHAIWRTRGSL